MEVATASEVAPHHHHNTRRRHERVKEDAEAPPPVAACSASSHEESEYVSEDEQIQHLDKSGALEQVVGSQSILSQELHNLGETNQGVGGLSQDIPGFSQQSAASSSRGMDSQQLAHKYGLLSQDPMECDDAVEASDVEEEENGEDEDEENEDGDGDDVDDMDYQLSTRHLEPSFSQESSSSQGSFSQNDKIGTLLEAVQMFQSQDEQEEEKLRKIKATKKSKGTSRSNYMNSGSSHLGWSVASPEPAKENLVRGTRSSSRINSGSYKPKSNPKMPSLPLATRKTKKCSPKKKATGYGSKSKTVCAKKTVVAKKTIASQMPVIVVSDPHPAILTDEAQTAVTLAKAEAVPPTKAKETKDEGPVISLRKRKNPKDPMQQMEQKLAQRAAELAQRTINEPELAKRLLLSMALTRENPRSAPEKLPGPGATLPEGFFWAHYPPLEGVLKDAMAEYYELSVTRCQSAQQQSFNNRLVELVRAECDRQQWLFAPCFTDKILRDRIRCYYKTHIQNAKKRLRTMVKNPTKRANARHLCSHLDMITKNMVHNNEEEKKTEPPTGINHVALADGNNNGVITHQDWGSAMAGSTSPEKAAAMRASAQAAQQQEQGQDPTISVPAAAPRPAKAPVIKQEAPTQLQSREKELQAVSTSENNENTQGGSVVVGSNPNHPGGPAPGSAPAATGQSAPQASGGPAPPSGGPQHPMPPYGHHHYAYGRGPYHPPPPGYYPYQPPNPSVSGPNYQANPPPPSSGAPPPYHYAPPHYGHHPHYARAPGQAPAPAPYHPAPAPYPGAYHQGRPPHHYSYGPHGHHAPPPHVLPPPHGPAPHGHLPAPGPARGATPPASGGQAPVQARGPTPPVQARGPTPPANGVPASGPNQEPTPVPPATQASSVTAYPSGQMAPAAVGATNGPPIAGRQPAATVYQPSGQQHPRSATPVDRGGFVPPPSSTTAASSAPAPPGQAPRQPADPPAPLSRPQPAAAPVAAAHATGQASVGQALASKHDSVTPATSKAHPSHASPEKSVASVESDRTMVI